MVSVRRMEARAAGARKHARTRAPHDMRHGLLPGSIIGAPHRFQLPEEVEELSAVRGTTHRPANGCQSRHAETALQDGCPGQPSASRISPRSLLDEHPPQLLELHELELHELDELQLDDEQLLSDASNELPAFRGSKRRHPRCGLHGLRIHRPCGAGQRGRAEQRGSPQQRVGSPRSRSCVCCAPCVSGMAGGLRAARGSCAIRRASNASRPAAVAPPRPKPVSRHATIRYATANTAMQTASSSTGRPRLRPIASGADAQHDQHHCTRGTRDARISPGAQSQPCARIPSTTSCTYRRAARETGHSARYRTAAP